MAPAQRVAGRAHAHSARRIGIIYEARPNVTADAAALCLKSGNAVILRGGSEAHHSNQAIAAVLRESCAETRVPQDAIQVAQSKEHALVNELLQLEEYIDLIIPRGGEELIRAVVANSKIPVIKHYKGSVTFTSMRKPRWRWQNGSASTPKSSVRLCATQWKRCWCMRRSRQIFAADDHKTSGGGCRNSRL